MRKHGWILLNLLLLAIALALIVDTYLVLNSYEPLPPITKTIIVRELVRPPLPEFPQLAKEEPDAGVDAGVFIPPFSAIDLKVVGITWDINNPWFSTVTLGYYPDYDKTGIYSLCDCDGVSPCNMITENYKLVAIGPNNIKILHIPSGQFQEEPLGSDSRAPKDMPNPILIWKKTSYDDVWRYVNIQGRKAERTE